MYFIKINEIKGGRTWKLLCTAKVAHSYPHLTLTILQSFRYVFSNEDKIKKHMKCWKYV